MKLRAGVPEPLGSAECLIERQTYLSLHQSKLFKNTATKLQSSMSPSSTPLCAAYATKQSARWQPESPNPAMQHLMLLVRAFKTVQCKVGLMKLFQTLIESSQVV